MMATDYPFEKIEKGVNMITKDCGLPAAEQKAYLYDNAKTLGFAKNI